MYNDANSLSRIHEVISKGMTGAIVLPVNHSLDALAASAALYLGLNKMGKTIAFVCENEANTPEIVASDKIQSNLATGGNNLVISFPYTDGSIDKVDYNIQGDLFNLIITPRANYPKLDPEQVKFSYTGGNLDFIITVDSPNLQSLGMIYENNQDQFQGRDIINIDRHLTNSFFGTVNFVNKSISSISELIFKVLQSLKIEIDKEMATNLYLGISSATNNFSSYSVNAETFETVAKLLRMGAIKKSFRKNEPLGFDNKNFVKSTPKPISRNRQNFTPKQNSYQEIPPEKPIEIVEKEDKTEEPPQDWLKPKIFHGGDLI